MQPQCTAKPRYLSRTIHRLWLGSAQSTTSASSLAAKGNFNISGAHLRNYQIVALQKWGKSPCVHCIRPGAMRRTWESIYPSGRFWHTGSGGGNSDNSTYSSNVDHLLRRKSSLFGADYTDGRPWVMGSSATYSRHLKWGPHARMPDVANFLPAKTLVYFFCILHLAT